MYTTQLLKVLLVALTTASAAQGLFHDVQLNIPHRGHVLARQVDASGGSDDNVTTPDSSNTTPTTPPAAVTTPTSTPVVTTPTPSPTPSPSPSPSPSQETTPPSPSPSEPAATTPMPTPEPTEKTEKTEKTTPPPSTSPTTPASIPKVTSTETEKDSHTAGEVLSTATEFITKTMTDDKGQIHTSVSTTKRVSTATPGLANPQKQGETGMSTQTRNTVIGVVVGVGGAAILAGIAFLFFRLHRRKAVDEGDGLMEYDTGYPAAEKQSDVGSSISPGSGRSPFQSTLETYHAPTQVNQASNF